jgi:hypothetical protein
MTFTPGIVALPFTVTTTVSVLPESRERASAITTQAQDVVFMLEVC